MVGVWGDLPPPNLANVISGLTLQQPPNWSSCLLCPQGPREVSLSHRSPSHPLFRIRSDLLGLLACLTKSCTSILLQEDLSPPSWCPRRQSPSSGFASPLSFPLTQNSFPHFRVLECTIPGIMCPDYSLLLLCLLISSSCFGHQLRYDYLRKAFFIWLSLFLFFVFAFVWVFKSAISYASKGSLLVPYFFSPLLTVTSL